MVTVRLRDRVVRRLTLGGPLHLVRIPVAGGTAVLELGRGEVRLLPLPLRLSPTEESSRVGFISQPGQSLICLPLRLVVTIEGGGAPDAVLP